MITLSNIHARSVITSNVIRQNFPPIKGFRGEDGQVNSPSISFNNDQDTGIFRPTEDTISFATGGSVQATINTSNMQIQQFLTVSSNILPNADKGCDLGTSNMRFNKAYIETLHIGPNTLYIGDTPILGTENDTIQIKADPDQSITMKTTGIAETSLISESGVNVTTSGLNANVVIQSTGVGGQITFGATDLIKLTAPITTVSHDATVSGNLTVSGDFTVNGQNTVVNTQTLEVKDNIIVLNGGQIGNSGVTAGQSGIEIDRGDLDNYKIYFDETSDKLTIGTTSMQPVATEAYVDQAILENTNLNDAALSNATLSGTTTFTGSIYFGSNVGKKLVMYDTSFLNPDQYYGMAIQNNTQQYYVGADTASHDFYVYSNNLPIVVAEMGLNNTTFTQSNINSGLTIRNQSTNPATKSYLTVGHASSTNDAANFRYTYRGTGSGSNYVGIGFWDNDDILTTNENGRVGVNTTDPLAPLHVVGDIYADTGSVIASSNVVGYSTISSDSNLKTAFLPIEDALSKVEAIGAYTFQYRADSKGQRYAGVIAQEVQKVLPEVVSKHPLDDTLTVAYGNLTTLVIAGLQELKAEVDAIKKRI